MTGEEEEEVVGGRTISSYTATGAVENSRKHGGAMAKFIRINSAMQYKQSTTPRKHIF